jgi:hypothetical protein
MRFWLAIGGESVGPYTVEEIEGMLGQHHITRDTPALAEDAGEDGEWGPLSGLPEFRVPGPPPPNLRPPTRRPPPVAGLVRPPAISTAPGASARPIPVAQPSSATPIIIILVVIAVLAGVGGIVVHQHSQNRKREIAAAEAKAEEQRKAAEEAAKKAAELAANPALRLKGASREQIIAALKAEAGAEVVERPFTVDLSGTPTSDVHVAMVEGLRELEVLRLGGGKISDGGLAPLAGLNRLRELSIGMTATGDGGPMAEAPHTGDLEITDAGLEHLTDLKGLRKVRLRDCKITDAGLEILDRIQWLSELELVNTAVTEAGARHFAKENPEIAVTVRSPGFTLEP